MTKEEAIAYFIDSNERIISVAKDENRYNYETQQIEDVFMRRSFEANDMAIKALEKEPCDKYIKEIDHLRKYISKLETRIVEKEPCEDCISREKVLKLFATHDGKHLYEAIRALPSVQPKSKTGHWMDAGNRGYADVDSDNIILYQEMCNRCKCLSCFRKSSGLLIGAKYCPNCGAKMEE